MTSLPDNAHRTRWPRVLLVWLALAGLMIVHGGLREWLIAPVIGALPAHQLSCFSASAIVLCTAWISLEWMGAAGSPRAQLAVGAAWLCTTVAFEFVFGHFAMGHSWARLIADYDVTAGRLWLLVIIVTFLAPWLAGRLRARSPDTAVG